MSRRTCWNCGATDPKHQGVEGMRFCNRACEVAYRAWLNVWQRGAS